MTDRQKCERWVQWCGYRIIEKTQGQMVVDRGLGVKEIHLFDSQGNSLGVQTTETIWSRG